MAKKKKVNLCRLAIEPSNEGTEAPAPVMPTERLEEDPVPPKIPPSHGSSNFWTGLATKWAEIPSRTPSQSEVDEISSPTVTKETAENASLSKPSSPIEPTTSTKQYDGDFDEGISNITITTFTKDYDSTIIVKDKSDGKVIEYQVSKDILSISSPVLKSLISSNLLQCASGLQDGQTTAPPGEYKHTLHLEGHPSAFEAILSIIHFVPDKKVLLNISFDTFTEIAVLVEKFSGAGHFNLGAIYGLRSLRNMPCNRVMRIGYTLQKSLTPINISKDW
ncbi:hypothetical protein TWF281_003084 [Arthrobotrys megalospora]